MTKRMTEEDREAKVAMPCRDAIFHAIRGTNEINTQSQMLWSEFDASDCEYHLTAAIGYLRQIQECVNGTAHKQ